MTTAKVQRTSGAVQRLLVSLVLVSSCASGTAAPVVTPSAAPVATATSIAASVVPTSAAPPLPTTSTLAGPTTPPTTTVPPTLASDVLADISATAVPANVIVPTTPASLDPSTNPINGRRSEGARDLAGVECATATPSCLPGRLDMLGFDVAGGSAAERERRVERATAVVQLDAGLPVTGLADHALLRYLGIDGRDGPDDRASETRRIGTSAQGRPIVARRYGEGPTVVLVVGQTHGDEEGGLRVLLRAESLPLPDGITLWVVPTMNPDGLVLDTRFLANGADPNRHAPSQPEQQAVYDFAVAIRPSLTIWYHQNYGWIGGSGASAQAARQYQELTRLGTLKRSGDCASGFMWCPIDEAIGSSSVLVELPDVLTPADVHLHASALLEVASAQAP